jgi:ABC-2 type transport system ATP-binding protein
MRRLSFRTYPLADASSASSLPQYAIEATGLTKTYAASKKMPAKQALKGIDLQIPRGSIFGLLGPNGAGKSTFINILAGLVNKTSGSVKIWGIDADKKPRESRAALGVVPQEINMDPFFTPRETLELMAGFYGVPAGERRTDEILDALGLGDKKHAYVRQLSGGMKRRLMVAKAMVHSPPILILDEPTAGVDVELRKLAVGTMCCKLNAQGVTVVLTTHYLEEAQEMCDQIAIVNHGQVVVVRADAEAAEAHEPEDVGCAARAGAGCGARRAVRPVAKPAQGRPVGDHLQGRRADHRTTPPPPARSQCRHRRSRNRRAGPRGRVRFADERVIRR